MKNNIADYLLSAAEGIKPYVKTAGGYVSDAAKYAGNIVNNKRRKIKRRNFFEKLTLAVQTAANLVLLAASVIALIIAVSEYIKDREI